MKHHKAHKQKSIVQLNSSGAFVANPGVVYAPAQTGTLFKGDRSEIKLIGVYPLKKHKYLYAYAYDGQRKLDGSKNVVGQSMGETDLVKACARAEEFVAELLKHWDQKYGANGTTSATQAPALPPEGCIQAQILDRLNMKRA